jgi:RNA polymerase sigma factor (sigma-70 family)
MIVVVADGTGPRRDRLGERFAAVVDAARAGETWALEQLWLAYAGPVRGYLRLHRVPDADDLTSDVFLGAFRTIERFTGDEAAFRSWLFTIAHRRVADVRRAAGRRPALEPLDEPALPPEPAPDAEVLQRLAEERVQALCGRLAPDQRDVLLLRLVGGLTVDEVADALGKSSGAVKALQRRGLAALRRILEREGVPL